MLKKGWHLIPNLSILLLQGLEKLHNRAKRGLGVKIPNKDTEMMHLNSSPPASGKIESKEWGW